MVYAKGREPCIAPGALLLAPLFNLRQKLGFLSSALPRHCAVILHGLAPRMSPTAELGLTWRLHCNPLAAGAESDALSSGARKVVIRLFSGVEIIKQGSYPCYHSTHLKTLIQILHE